MNEDFELQPLQTICEGTLVTVSSKEKLEKGIVLGSFSARNRTSYVIVLLKRGSLIRVTQGNRLGFCENIMIAELLSHDNELIRDWFSGLARGDYTREHLAAWFLEVQEEQHREETIISENQVRDMQRTLKRLRPGNVLNKNRNIYNRIEIP